MAFWLGSETNLFGMYGTVALPSGEGQIITCSFSWEKLTSPFYGEGVEGSNSFWVREARTGTGSFSGGCSADGPLQGFGTVITSLENTTAVAPYGSEGRAPMAPWVERKIGNSSLVAGRAEENPFC